MSDSEILRNMATSRTRFNKAVNRLSKYNGLYTISDLASDAVFQSTVGRVGLRPQDQSLTRLGTSDIEAEIIKLFIDTTEGAPTTANLFTELKLRVGDNSDTKTSLRKIFPIYYENNMQSELYGGPVYGDINTMLGVSSETNTINTTPNSPTKASPGLSIIVSNSSRVGLTERNTNPSVIFLNAIPNVEMSRATAFVDITLSVGRPALDSGGRIQTMGLPKFLVGAKNAKSKGPLNDLVQGNQIFNGDPVNQSTAEIRWSEARAVAGMELFTSPQTLVNANETDNQGLRSNPVLDKFRPFMSITNFEVTVVPSTGMMSYKSAKLGLILHDRSRLSEIADFIKPDLYGTTELLIEYGWHHPDGESITNSNAYGDLINGMRVKEKYSILNSSFNLNDAGEVGINLELFTRGAEAFVTELISSDENDTGNILREIQGLQREIAELRSRIYGSGTNTTTREIRGVQILDAAQDAQNNTVLTPDLTKALTNFRTQLRSSSSGNSQARTNLLSSLSRLYGENTSTNGNRRTPAPEGESLAVQLRRSIQESVREKMIKLSNGIDPMLDQEGVETTTDGTITGARQVRVGLRRNERNREQRNSRAETLIINAQAEQDRELNIAAGATSLGKLLLLFVGQPIANTGKYDDVQMIFYPFNAYAGKASRINIANFAVDNEFFAQNFARWRLDRIGRSANVNLSDFINFVGSTILDDPGAKSYGLVKDGRSLFQTIQTVENGRVTENLQQIADPADHLAIVEEVLRGVTPDGTFRLPQIDIYLEAVPEKTGQSDGNLSSATPEKTILRIHIFDRLASTYDTLGSLLANTRNTELSAIGSTNNAPPVREGEQATAESTEVVESRNRIHSSFLSSALSYGVIEKITPANGEPDEPVMYRITGGSRRLKDFLYRTVPYITYGAIGSNVKNAQLSSIQDPALNTVNMLRSYRRTEIEPNGENPGGLPLRVIPTTLNLTTLGCPLISFAQQYFVDFQTGTTADNIYGVTGIVHTFSQGEFNTSIKFGPMDAYGRYMSVISQVRTSQAVLGDLPAEENQ